MGKKSKRQRVKTRKSPVQEVKEQESKTEESKAEAPLGRLPHEMDFILFRGDIFDSVDEFFERMQKRHEPALSITKACGRMVCYKHGRECCFECFVNHREKNSFLPIEKGFRRPLTRVDELLLKFRTNVLALDGEEAAKCLDEIHRISERSVAEPKKVMAMSEMYSAKIEIFALLDISKEIQKSGIPVGQAKMQRIFETYIQSPMTSHALADAYSCSYCSAISTTGTTLPCCSRCKKDSFCSRECQVAAWPAHKQVCLEQEEEAEYQPLTWEQLQVLSMPDINAEQDQGIVACVGKSVDEVLTVKLIHGNPDPVVVGQDVYEGRDRSGICRTVCIDKNLYPSATTCNIDRLVDISMLSVGAIIHRKKPRYTVFQSGHEGIKLDCTCMSVDDIVLEKPSHEEDWW